MSRLRLLLLLVAAAMLCAGGEALAQETAAKPAPAEKITMVVKVEPNEVRSYKVSVQMKGRAAPEPSAKPVDMEAAYSMKIQHKYGRREGDGLLPLEIAAVDAEATVDGEKLALPETEFPKITLLIDRSWKVTSTFGLSGTRYAGQSPGLNYGNLIMLFFIPEADKLRAVGESWPSKVKLPGLPSECGVTTTLKSVDTKDGVKTVTIHQDYVWTGQKLENGEIANSKAAVDSTFALDTGKLLKSHADCQVDHKKAGAAQQDNGGDQTNTKIDILLEKQAPVNP
jgi:hypothetical protein